MTGPNASSGIEGSEKPRKSEADLYSELIKGFSSNYILHGSLSETDKNQLVRDIMLNTTIVGTNIETELQRYIAGKDEFSGLDISKINIFQLRNKVSGAFFVRKNNQERLKEQILKNYNITPSQYSSDLQGHVNGLSDRDLMKSIALETDREKFLKEKLGNIPERKNQVSILPTISERESANRINRLNERDKHDVKVVLDRVHFENKLDTTDIDILIESGYLNGSEVKELVKNFIPYISLQEAIDIGLLNAAAAGTIRDRLIGEYADENNVTLDAATKSEIQTSLSLTDVLISTEDYAVNDADFVKIGKEIKFKNFAEDVSRRNQEIKQELRQRGPVSFESLRQGILDIQNPNLRGFEKFNDDSILEFTSIKDGENQKQYIKLVGKNEADRKFSFRKVGAGAINMTSNSEIEHLDYNTFYENLKNTRDSIDVYSQSDIREKIESGDIETSEFQSYDEEDFNGSDRVQKINKIQEKYTDQLEREIELAKQDVEKNPGITLYKTRLEAKQKELEDLRNTSILPAQAAEKANFFQLTDKLDNWDPEGKSLGLEKGNFIETKTNAFQIVDLDIQNEMIFISGINNSREPLSFADFLEAFKKQKATRAKKVSNFTELIDRVSSDLEWGNYKFESGKFIGEKIEHGGKIEDREIDFMVGKESDTLVKIVSITDGYVEIQRGEVEDTKSKDGKEGQNLKIKGAPTEQYTLNEFARFIESEKLIPDWKIGKDGLEIYPDGPQNKRNGGQNFGGLMWSIFVGGRMSLSELMAGGKMIPELMEEYFKKGSDIKAAKAALAMGKFLPKQMRDELLIKVERAESESMEKALEDLGKIDSPLAVKRIEGWLLDKNTPEYNKEAGMLFMLQKYGHLTSKGPMYPYRGKFLWYEAMGGRINDALYVRIKKELEDDGQNFSEEFLMWMLMKEQCKGGHYSGIKRRGRIHKEFEHKFKSGMEEEFEKGYKDANTKRTAAKMVKEGMDEALGGTTTNALGWMKKAVERGGSLEDMMEISFSLMFSGAVFDMDQASYLRAKSLWDSDGQPVISQRFMSSKSEMQLFNDTVLELCKEMQILYPKYSNIYSEAKVIFDNISKRGQISEKDRLTAANKFWHKYGKALSRALNFSLQDDNEFSLTDTLIKRKKGKNPTFKRYYEKASGYVGEGNYFKEEFVDDWAGDTGIYGLNTFKMAEKFLAMDQGGALKKGSPAKKVWAKMYGDINSTRNKQLEPGVAIDSEINKQAQVDYIVGQLEEITAGLLSVHGGRTGILPSINNATGHLGEQFNAWGIHVANDLNDVSPQGIKNGDKRKYFEKKARDIINGVNNDTSELGDTPSALTQRVKSTVAQTHYESDGYTD